MTTIATPWHLDERIPDFPVPVGATAAIAPPLPDSAVPSRVTVLHWAVADAVAVAARPLLLSGTPVDHHGVRGVAGADRGNRVLPAMHMLVGSYGQPGRVGVPSFALIAAYELLMRQVRQAADAARSQSRVRLRRLAILLLSLPAAAARCHVCRGHAGAMRGVIPG
jgi:hypothetical protein